MRTVHSSWKAPWLRKLARYSFSDLDSTSHSIRDIIDHQMGEIGLAGDRAHRREFGRGETRDIVHVGMGIRHALQRLGVGRVGNARGMAEVGEFRRMAHGPGL